MTQSLRLHAVTPDDAPPSVVETPTRRALAVMRLAGELIRARDEVANAQTAFERQMWTYHATNIERIIKEVGERDVAERKKAEPTQ